MLIRPRCRCHQLRQSIQKNNASYLGILQLLDLGLDCCICKRHLETLFEFVRQLLLFSRDRMFCFGWGLAGEIQKRIQSCLVKVTQLLFLTQKH